jgi:hypothetical protein
VGIKGGKNYSYRSETITPILHHSNLPARARPALPIGGRASQWHLPAIAMHAGI